MELPVPNVRGFSPIMNLYQLALPVIRNRSPLSLMSLQGANVLFRSNDPSPNELTTAEPSIPTCCILEMTGAPELSGGDRSIA